MTKLANGIGVRPQSGIVHYFVATQQRPGELRPLSKIFSEISNSKEWHYTVMGQLPVPENPESLASVFDEMVSAGVLRSDNSGTRVEPWYGLAVGQDIPWQNANAALPSTSEFNTEASEELIDRIDSTAWTGLAKRISPAQVAQIREQANKLLAAIVQSDADAETKADACKRVEAVILLLEAPNTPWREVVALLSHPTVNAFFVSVAIVQMILGALS